MSVKKLNKLIKKTDAEFLGLAEFRERVAEAGGSGYVFSAQTAIDGPWTLLGLVVNGESVIAKPIPTTGRIINVDITKAVEKSGEPFEFQSAILFGQKQPKCVTYIVKDAAVTKYSTKNNADGGTIWVAPVGTFPKEE